ncbi:ABC transporter permease [Paenarthrobacter sp. NPDC089675]|uniref:ABC transporter permease n=1 Tax=Paenarthrobacter sp. NPDC089675 TaxID=3364376 RepID=UPI003804BAEB
MIRLILRRLMMSAPLVFVVTGLSFVLLGLLPGNAAQSILGQNATPESIAALEREMGLDQPLLVQYWNWVSGVLRGDLGNSLLNHQEVFPALMGRLGVTLSLLIGALTFAVVFGVLIGVLTARSRGFWSRAVDVLAVGGLAIPSFWLALLLILFFAVQLRIFPATGYVRPEQSITSWMWFLALPVVSLGVHMVTSIAKQTRDAMRDSLSSPYVLGLRANGISEKKIVFRHALRNAAIPIVTIVGLLFVGSLTGAVVAESIFVLPGLGTAVVAATSHRDIPMIQGAALLLTLIVVFVNVVVDLAYGWLNPKVRTR